MTRFPALTVGLALLAVALVMIWRSTQVSETAGSMPQRGETGTASDIEIPWRVDMAQHYNVHTDSSMQMSAGGGYMRVTMDASLDMLTLEAGPGEAVVGMRLSAVDLHVNGSSDGQVNAALSTPFRVRFTRGGMPSAFEYPEHVDLQSRLTLENLVRMFQVTAGAGSTWTAQESNGSGSYEAVYRRIGAAEVAKSKRRFDAMDDTSMLKGANIESSETFRLDAKHDWLVSMAVDDKLLADGQGGPAISITNHATLDLDPKAKSTLTIAELQFQAASEPRSSATSIGRSIPDITPEQARNRILAVLPQLDAATSGRTSWIHELRDLLLVDPTMPDVILDALRGDDLSDRTRADLYLALELAGSDSAQAALSSVISDSNNWATPDTMRAIVALGGVQQPNPDSLGTLWNASQTKPFDIDSERVAGGAAYALGRLGQTMNENHDPEYPGLRENLLSNALSGGDTIQRSNFVHAVGNTHDASLTGDVLHLLDDPEPDVRRAAALALGRLDTDQAAGSLLQRLETETNRDVRSALSESLVGWSEPTPQAMEHVRAVLPGEQNEATRYNMARFLSANLDKDPENRTTLQQLLRTEQSKRIRQFVANALAADQLGKQK